MSISPLYLPFFHTHYMVYLHYIFLVKLYTVIRNVRQAHECLEIGESQQFFDEVHYLLDSIKPSQPLSVRCLGWAYCIHCFTYYTRCSVTTWNKSINKHNLGITMHDVHVIITSWACTEFIASKARGYIHVAVQQSCSLSQLSNVNKSFDNDIMTEKNPIVPQFQHENDVCSH